MTGSASTTSSIPASLLESVIAGDESRHAATAHDDTTTGATHCFQDEYGNWLTYTFGDTSGVAASFAADPYTGFHPNAGDMSIETFNMDEDDPIEADLHPEKLKKRRHNYKWYELNCYFIIS